MGLGFRRDDEERAVTKGYVNSCHIQDYGTHELLNLGFVKVTRGYVKKAGFLVPRLMYTFEAI
jgi:hypothetical protein